MNNYDSYAKKTSKILEAISNLNHPNAFTECLSVLIEQNPWKFQEYLCGNDSYSGNDLYDCTIFIVKPHHLDSLYRDLTATVEKISSYQHKAWCGTFELNYDFFSYRQGMLLETFFMIDAFLNALNDHTIAVYERNSIGQFNDTISRRIEELRNVPFEDIQIVSSALAATISTTTIDCIVARLMRLVGKWLTYLEIRDIRATSYVGFGRSCCESADKLIPADCKSPYKLWDFNPFTLYEFEGGRV